MKSINQIFSCGTEHNHINGDHTVSSFEGALAPTTYSFPIGNSVSYISKEAFVNRIRAKGAQDSQSLFQNRYQKNTLGHLFQKRALAWEKRG